jgi:hypothetical protein
MVNLCEYENDSEKGQHLRAMRKLSEDLHIPMKDVRDIYEEVLCKVRDGAKIKDFLVILVSRHVKELIKKDTAAGGQRQQQI